MLFLERFFCRVKYLIYFFLILIFTVSFSCKKDDSEKQSSSDNKIPKTEVNNEGESDTIMTPQEIFSSALVQNILGIEEDDDLEVYLEEEIYPVVSKSNKVTLDKISSSEYLLTYGDEGNRKYFLLQKFYDPVKDEFVFEKKETDNLKR